MKKILLTLILCVCVGFSTFGLFGCKKDKGYELANLFNDYKTIADECKSVVYDENNGELEFDYSVFVNAKGQKYFTDATEYMPYHNLSDYNFILNRSLRFVNRNIQALSTNSFTVKNEYRNDVKTKLDALKRAFIKTDIQVQEFARNLNTNSGRQPDQDVVVNDLYIQIFKRLLDSYNSLFESSYNLTLSLARVYYSITDNYQDVNMSDVNLDDWSEEQTQTFMDNFVLGLANRCNLEMAGYSYIFYQKNLKDGTMSEALTWHNYGQGYKPMGEVFNNYAVDVMLITNNYATAPGMDRKTDIYELSIQLYNIWSALKSDYEKFYKAHNSIDYVAGATESNFEQNEFEIACGKIIDNYFYLIEQDIKVLKEVHNII